MSIRETIKGHIQILKASEALSGNEVVQKFEEAMDCFFLAEDRRERPLENYRRPLFVASWCLDDLKKPTINFPEARKAVFTLEKYCNALWKYQVAKDICLKMWEERELLPDEYKQKGKDLLGEPLKALMANLKEWLHNPEDTEKAANAVYYQLMLEDRIQWLKGQYPQAKTPDTLQSQLYSLRNTLRATHMYEKAWEHASAGEPYIALTKAVAQEGEASETALRDEALQRMAALSNKKQVTIASE